MEKNKGRESNGEGDGRHKEGMRGQGGREMTENKGEQETREGTYHHYYILPL